MSVAKIIAAMGGVGFAQFITEHHATFSGGATVSYSGAQAGDLALMIIMYDSAVVPTGYRAAGASVAAIVGGTDRAFYRVLTGADISAGSISLSGSPNGAEVALLVYRGPTIATVVSSFAGSASSATIPGFAKSPNCKGVVSYATCGGSPAIGTPSGMTTRINSYSGPSGDMSVADFLPAAAYVSGTDLIWTGLLAGNANGGQIIELT